ncbi:hypothetical protein J6590_078300 [Homalodisca vitripennis]|nr:hypothetical protein J6590_078300 [Homalodisca vitripennis]
MQSFSFVIVIIIGCYINNNKSLNEVIFNGHTQHGNGGMSHPPKGLFVVDTLSISTFKDESRTGVQSGNNQTSLVVEKEDVQLHRKPIFDKIILIALDS